MVKHQWDEDEINKYHDARCSKCGMKFSYSIDAVKALMAWSKKEQDTEEWKTKMNHYTECEKA